MAAVRQLVLLSDLGLEGDLPGGDVGIPGDLDTLDGRGPVLVDRGIYAEDLRAVRAERPQVEPRERICGD
jgi:hypothetical protein